MKNTCVFLWVAVLGVLMTSGLALAQGREVLVAFDPPCVDNLHRYVDCGNGTVTDSVTNLVWLRDANCSSLPGLGAGGTGTYQQAVEAAAQLHSGVCGLTDGSRPGDWRLPTKAEWQQTIARALELGCFAGAVSPKGPPVLTNDSSLKCLIQGPTPFIDVQSSNYWSSESNDAEPLHGWYAELLNGAVFNDDRATPLFVWPVRSGQ